ncbi:MAG: inosine/xanthosine triphosphatase [Promethearchaeota archaeon]
MVSFNICVGSLNPTKVDAVKNAFDKYFTDFEIFKIKVESGVPNQPIGINLILEGAKNRAEYALSYLMNEKEIDTNIFGVGIEAGLVKVSLAQTNYMDFQFCVIIDEKSNITLGSGIAFEYPKSIIKEILSNHEIEIGTIIGKLANNINLKNEAGAVSFCRWRIIARQE